MKHITNLYNNSNDNFILKIYKNNIINKYELIYMPLIRKFQYRGIFITRIEAEIASEEILKLTNEEYIQ